MKRTLARLAVLALLLGLATVAAAEPEETPVKLDASVFTLDETEENFDAYECMCSINLGLEHMEKDGIAFFKWCGGDRMPDNVVDEEGIGCCFADTKTTNISYKTVVFLDGVPNLCKDLFKAWESVTKDVYIPDSVTEIDEDCFELYSRITLHFTENNKVALDYARRHCMRYEVIGKGYAGDKAVMDASIFEIPEGAWLNYPVCACMDGFFLNLGHYGAYGIDFFLWGGGEEKMPPQVPGSCFSGGVSGFDKIVFWDGVPNLSENLFTACEGEVQDVYIPDSVKEIDENCFVMNSTITLHFTENNEVALDYAKARGMRYEIMGKGYGGAVKLDDTAFELPMDLYESYDTFDCMCSDVLGIYHYEKAGVTFFQWVGGDGKMPSEIGGSDLSGELDDPSIQTVVFWNGVPNLPKDLFKAWEGTTQDVYIPDTVTEIDEDAFVMNSTIRLHFTKNNAVALAYAKARGMKYEILGQGWGGPVTFDTSIFDGAVDLVERDCLEHTYLISLRHYEKYGVSYFEYFGGSVYMIGINNWQPCCFTEPPEDGSMETVVFMKGVPTLCKNLFKWLEGTTHDVYIPDSVYEIAEKCFVDGSTITLHFTANNKVALAYAQNREMAFEVMDGERVKGDVDFDKSVDMKDVLSLRKSIAKLPAAVEIYSTDLNADGSVDMKDVLTLRKQIANAAA